MSKHEWGRGSGKEYQADSLLSMEPEVLDPRTLNSWLEPESRGRHLTDWANQVPLITTFAVLSVEKITKTVLMIEFFSYISFFYKYNLMLAVVHPDSWSKTTWSWIPALAV